MLLMCALHSGRPASHWQHVCRKAADTCTRAAYTIKGYSIAGIPPSANPSASAISVGRLCPFQWSQNAPGIMTTPQQMPLVIF